MVIGFDSMTIPLTLLVEEAFWWEDGISGRAMQSSQRGSWKPELLPPEPLLCWW